MWFLRGAKDDIIYLKRNSTITVGRIQGDIILRDDKSVSRNHAAVFVQSKVEDKKTLCFVKDIDSKYGSSIIRGNEKIKVTKEGVQIEHNDTIKFGLQHNDYIACYIPTVVLVSSMNDTGELKSIMNDIDGYIIQEWSKPVTHLTTSRAKLGEKIAMALVNCIPIVGLEYWKTVQRAVKNNQDWPKISDHMLPITEDIIDNTKVSLAPNFNRKTLFNNLTFLFFSYSQFNIYKKIVKDAGGQCLMFNATSHTDLKKFCSDEFIVVYYMIGANQTEESILESQRSKTAYEEIEDLLRKSKRRMISDSEIMLSILHCSLQQYCNPKHNYKKHLVDQKTKDVKEKKKSSIFALDTEDANSRSMMIDSDNIIQETNDLTSQDIGDSESNATKQQKKDRAPSMGISEISSIPYDSQASTNVIENSFSKLNMDQKRPEKRTLDSDSSLPTKKVKFTNSNSLFPVLSKKNTQKSQSFLNSQETQSSLVSKNSQSIRNSQLRSENNDSVLCDDEQATESQNSFVQPSTSKGAGKQTTSKSTKNIFSDWLDDSEVEGTEKEKYPEKRKITETQSQKNESFNEKPKEGNKVSQSLRVRSDSSLLNNFAANVKNKTSESNKRDSEEIRETCSNISEELNVKKRRINSKDSSNSSEIHFAVERNDKRKRDSGGEDSDSFNLIRQKKQHAVNDKNHFQKEVSENLIDDDNKDCVVVKGLIRQTFHHSLDDSIGYKIFHKAYNTIPRMRITHENLVPFEVEND